MEVQLSYQQLILVVALDLAVLLPLAVAAAVTCHHDVHALMQSLYEG